MHTVVISIEMENIDFCVFNLRFIAQKTLYGYHFFQINSFLMLFYSIINSSDMIVPCLFRGKFFTHRGTPPTNFHGTIRCDDNFILHATFFYLYSVPLNRWRYRVYL